MPECSTDGGLHPAVDGQSLSVVLMVGYTLQWMDNP